MSLSSAFILASGILPKTGDAYDVVLPTAAHITHVAQLQATVFQSLSPEEKSFLIERDEEDFKQHFAQGHAVVAAVSKGQLIAQALVVMPAPGHKDCGITDMQLPAHAKHIAVLGGDIVHPDYRGNQLQSTLTAARIAFATAAGRRHAVAEVAVGNTHSLKNLMRHGLKIHSMGQDASDGTVLYNLHAPLRTSKQLQAQTLTAPRPAFAF